MIITTYQSVNQYTRSYAGSIGSKAKVEFVPLASVLPDASTFLSPRVISRRKQPRGKRWWSHE